MYVSACILILGLLKVLCTFYLLSSSVTIVTLLHIVMFIVIAVVYLMINLFVSCKIINLAKDSNN